MAKFATKSALAVAGFALVVGVAGCASGPAPTATPSMPAPTSPSVTVSPTNVPSATPTPEPTKTAPVSPKPKPTARPTRTPAPRPTAKPTGRPTSSKPKPSQTAAPAPKPSHTTAPAPVPKPSKPAPKPGKPSHRPAAKPSKPKPPKQRASVRFVKSDSDGTNAVCYFQVDDPDRSGYTLTITVNGLWSTTYDRDAGSQQYSAWAFSLTPDEAKPVCTATLR